jgi:hypothetical protein
MHHCFRRNRLVRTSISAHKLACMTDTNLCQSDLQEHNDRSGAPCLQKRLAKQGYSRDTMEGNRDFESTAWSLLVHIRTLTRRSHAAWVVLFVTVTLSGSMPVFCADVQVCRSVARTAEP